MKTIKRVVLKEATILSQEEMKLIFGGSSLSPSQLINRTCKVNSSCSVTFPTGNVLTGNCQGMYSGGSVSCFCVVSGSHYPTTNLSHCFKGN